MPFLLFLNWLLLELPLHLTMDEFNKCADYWTCWYCSVYSKCCDRWWAVLIVLGFMFGRSARSHKPSEAWGTYCTDIWDTNRETSSVSIPLQLFSICHFRLSFLSGNSSSYYILELLLSDLLFFNNKKSFFFHTVLFTFYLFDIAGRNTCSFVIQLMLKKLMPQVL